jgi:PAS domain S-box-containing protein
MDDDDQRLNQPACPSDRELLQLVFDSATDFAIITQDPSGMITSWNQGASRLLGWSEAEAVGQDAAMIFTPDQRASGIPRQERQQALADGQAEDERWHQRQDGSLFWGSGLMMPLTDRRMGFVKIFRDRTAQHQAEARLAESEERFRLLATNIPQLVFRSRGSGSRTWGSPQWEVFTGLSFERSVQFGWLDAVHSDDRDATLAAWEKAQETGEYYAEHRIRRDRDGDYRWHQTRAKPIQDGAVDDWVGTSADIHDLRTLKDRQQVLMAELQHRTRNLLAVVQAIARQTQRNTATTAEFGAEFERRLGALSRVQGMLAKVDHQEIDLETLIRSELDAHRSDSTDIIRIEGPPVALYANSAQAIALALHELATNAVKYGAFCQPSGRLSITWDIAVHKDEERVLLHWVESNVRMPETTVPRRRGYGSELIERALPYQLKAKTMLEFGPDGVRCWISAPTARERREKQHG